MRGISLRIAAALPLAAVAVVIASPDGAMSRVGPPPIPCVSHPVTKDEPPSCPLQGRTVVVRPLSGVVFVTFPGGARVRLDEPHTIPVASIIDATHGRYRLTADEHSVGLRFATSDFYGGTAEVLQGVGARDATLDMRLVGGDFSRCGHAGAVSAAAHSHHAVQHLWGNGKGHFKISGQYASAVVRGTHWRLTDFCDGSGVTVARGLVGVTDLATGQVVLVSAGHSYFVPATRTYTFPTTCPSGNVPLGSVATISGYFSPPQVPSPPQIDYRAPSGATVTHTLSPDAQGNFSDQVTATERGVWSVTVHLANAASGGVPGSCSFSVT